MAAGRGLVAAARPAIETDSLVSMGDTPDGGTTARGRPRSEKAHKAILAAAAELLLERGLAEVSMDAVADRAGVSKATIYRWWPSKETLALDALYARWAAAAPVPRDTGSLRGDLIELLRPWVRLVRTGSYARVTAALLAEAQTDQAFAAQYQQHITRPRRDEAREIFGRAVERGEVPAGTDIEVAIDLIYGPLYLRLLQGHAPLSDEFVDALVDTALAGIRPRLPSLRNSQVRLRTARKHRSQCFVCRPSGGCDWIRGAAATAVRAHRDVCAVQEVPGCGDERSSRVQRVLPYAYVSDHNRYAEAWAVRSVW